MPRKILIIDNDSTVLNTFNTDLINNNYVVIPSRKGKCVFKQIEQEIPDIVLLDIHFTEADGFGIAEYLRDKEIPFIFISGSQDQIILKQSHTIGALGFLLKPININQLVIEIETALHFHSEKIQLDRRKENINATIDNNRKISVAIGLIMERYHSTGAQVFEAIRCAARTKQCRILDVSNSLIEGHENTLPSSPMSNNVSVDKALSTDEILSEIIKTITV